MIAKRYIVAIALLMLVSAISITSAGYVETPICVNTDFQYSPAINEDTFGPVSREFVITTVIDEDIFFSTEEDFITQGPKPPDGNPIISDGDLLYTEDCSVFARNRELLLAFEMEMDLGLDAADVIDAEKPLIVFSTELDDPEDRFTAGDLLATNGIIIPNFALMAAFDDISYVNLGLDAVHFIGDKENIFNFLKYIEEKGMYLWEEDPGGLSVILEEYDIDIWFSTEETAPVPQKPLFLDGDLLSARYGTIIAQNNVLLPASIPAGIPERGVDFGLDAVTAQRDGSREMILFSTEILYDENLYFTDGDILMINNGLVRTNEDLIRCFEPKVNFLGLDALSIEFYEEEEKKPDLLIQDFEQSGINGLCKIDYQILNTGTASAEGSTAYLYIDGDLIAEDLTDSLAPGESVWSEFTHQYTGTHIYKVCADGPDDINETDETNNCLEKEFTFDPVKPVEDIYFADAGESPGSVYHYITATGTEDTFYTRPAQNLYSFSFHPAIPEKLYYVNANENKIYRTNQISSGWTSEEVVYTHSTYIRDIAFAFNTENKLVLYFSESSGAKEDGKIYRIDSNNEASLYYTVRLEDVGGFWAGDFTFDDKGNLYLSSGNSIPASIYKVEGNSVEEIFRDEKEPIKGLIYRDGVLYYANWHEKIYRLDLNTKERTVIYSNEQRKWISDVGFSSPASGGGNIIYIYSTDYPGANSFKSLLDANGYPTTIIPIHDAEATDFSKYEVIIAGSDSGYLDNWGDPASVMAVENSDKPVIGIGEGGYALFGQLNLDTGHPNGWHGSNNNIYVIDPYHTIFHTPNSITIPKNTIIQIATSTDHVGIHLDVIPSNVIVLGKEVNNKNHYILTVENDYLFWGFTASVDSMTEVGKDLFINVVDYSINSS